MSSVIRTPAKLIRRSRTLAKLLRRPSHLSLLFHDMRRLTYPVESDGSHLDEAMAWLCRAQDASQCGGVSTGWFPVDGGWLVPYPETTGYIIPTFLEFASVRNDPTFFDRAVSMGDWELTIQLPSGRVPGGRGTNGSPVVFDTGQVISGWNALFRATGQKKYLNAAVRAARWLVEIQEHDGSWVTGTHKGLPRSYHARVAWPLFELSQLAGDTTFAEAAARNVTWVLSNGNSNGWIGRMGFADDGHPLTHTIAYTYRGLLESARYLDEGLRAVVLQRVKSALETLLLRYERTKVSPNDGLKPLPATVDQRWQFRAAYSCLVGSAQIAIIWFLLYRAFSDARFLNAAVSLVDQLKSTQSMDARNLQVRGAIPGSLPWWGGYGRLAFPNWASKFFADALMLKGSIMGSPGKQEAKCQTWL